MAERTCANCKHRVFVSGYEDFRGRPLYEPCLGYEMACTKEEEIETAMHCSRYAFDDREPEEEYTPSATNGDYSPSNPWDAPGMSIHDFI